MFFYTHPVDLAFKIISLLIFVGLVAVISSIIAPGLSSRRGRRMIRTIIVVVLLPIYYLGFHHPVMDVLATQVYVQSKFGVSTNWKQARELRVLFCGHLVDKKWYPAEAVLRLPLSQRLPVLLRAARDIAAKYGQPFDGGDPFQAIVAFIPSLSAPPTTTPAPAPGPPSVPDVPPPRPVELPDSAYHGTADTNFARNWVVLQGEKIEGIISARAAPEAQVAILYGAGGKNVAASALPQGFLNEWNLTPEKLKAANQ